MEAPVSAGAVDQREHLYELFNEGVVNTEKY